MPDEQPDVAVADVLTPLTKSVLRAGGDAAYTRLTVARPGSDEARRMLEGVGPAQLVARPVADEGAAAALLAALWLWHDWLDESHRLSQDLASPTGSFWHAVMHRREGDFANAKYWYARCRTHPVMRTIAVAAAPILGSPATRVQAGVADGFTVANGFDPAAFVDRVEEVNDRPDDPAYAAAVEVQKVEWRALFAACAFAAVGAGTLLGGGIES